MRSIFKAWRKVRTGRREEKRREEEKGSDLDFGKLCVAFNVTRKAAVAIDENGFADGAVLGGAADCVGGSRFGRRGEGEGLGDRR